MVHLLFSVIVFALSIKFNEVVVVLVESEAFWPAVVALFLRHHNGKDVLLVAEVFFVGSPNLHLILFFLKPNLLLGIHAREEHSIEAHVFGKSGIAFGYAKRVKLPAYTGVLNTKLLAQKLMASHEVVDDVISVCGSLVWSRHSSIDNLKLTILDQSFSLSFFQVILSLPPHFKEFHLGV